MIQKSNVTDQVVAYYKQQISSGGWRVGELIPSENQLSAELGVSRASIRGAVKELIGIGVLQSVHGKGTFLIDNVLDAEESARYRITAQDCMDIRKVLEFRQIVEPQACFLACRYVSEDMIEKLEFQFQAMRENISVPRSFVIADLDFHRTISAASGNPLIAKSLNRIFDEDFHNHEKMNQIFGYEDGIYYHSMILEAMRQGRGERAREIMYDHMQHAIDRLRDGKIAI